MQRYLEDRNAKNDEVKALQAKATSISDTLDQLKINRRNCDNDLSKDQYPLMNVL